jgi:hypothetical protein
MKGYGFRIWVANALIVGALSVIAMTLGVMFIPGLLNMPDGVFELLVLIVSAIALLFAILEAVLLYRGWKLAVAAEPAIESDAASAPAEDATAEAVLDVASQSTQE